jgi:hypothetical protein
MEQWKASLTWFEKIVFWWRSFFNVRGGSDDVLFGIKIYGSRFSEKGWFFIIKKLHRVFYKIYNIKFWILHRIHPKWKMHVVKTDLKPGYYDTDYVLLHAAFSCLGRYIEECKDSGCHDPGEEAKDLWHWWTVVRVENRKREDELCHHLFSQRAEFKPVGGELQKHVLREWTEEEEELYKEYRKLEEDNDQDEQDMLHKLIDIRRIMWT